MALVDVLVDRRASIRVSHLRVKGGRDSSYEHQMIELGGILKSPGIAVGISKSVAVASFARSVLDSMGNVSA